MAFCSYFVKIHFLLNGNRHAVGNIRTAIAGMVKIH